MAFKKSKLAELVKKEAKLLKKYATKTELRKLNVLHLNPSHTEKCVYGLMTGNCTSDRAHELISKCAPKTYAGAYKRGFTFVYSLPKLNGKINPEKRDEHSFRSWSPIEVYILNNKYEEKAELTKNLIDYLKGNRKTLIFK